jgi:hypothetical protein
MPTVGLRFILYFGENPEWPDIVNRSYCILPLEGSMGVKFL